MSPTRTIMALSLLCLSGCSVLPWGGGSETGVGGVEGVVVGHEHTGVRGANVSVMSASTPPETLGAGVTDARGQFRIDKVPAGRNLSVVVTKTYAVRTIRGKKEGVRVGGGNVTDLGEIELKAGQ